LAKIPASAPHYYCDEIRSAASSAETAAAGHFQNGRSANG